MQLLSLPPGILYTENLEAMASGGRLSATEILVPNGIHHTGSLGAEERGTGLPNYSKCRIVINFGLF